MIGDFLSIMELEDFASYVMKGVMSMKHLYAVVKGPFDSKKLWSLISRYDVNVTDLGDTVLVYGDVDIHDATDVLAFCSLFGDIIESEVG